MASDVVFVSCSILNPELEGYFVFAKGKGWLGATLVSMFTNGKLLLLHCTLKSEDLTGHVFVESLRMPWMFF